MKNSLLRSALAVLAIFTIIFLSCIQNQKTETDSAIFSDLNTLTEAEKAEGWILLFDGETFNGWLGLGREEIPEGHWIIEEGTIKKLPSGEIPLQKDGQPLEGGDIMTTKAFENFEW